MPLISATRQRIVDVQDFPGATAPVHGIHQRGGVTGQRLRRLKLGTRTREGHGGQPAQGGFGRRANGPAVKDVHTLVRAVVDAHDDQIRRLRQERGQGELHAVHGRPRDRRAAEAGLLHRVQAQGIVQGDGTAHARLLRERGDHVKLMPGLAQRVVQRAETRGVDTVIVGKQDTHATSRNSKNSFPIGNRRKAGAWTARRLSVDNTGENG